MYLGLLFVDIEAFKEKLHKWLLWYNTERPHEGLGLLSPLWHFTTNFISKESQSE